MTSKMYSNYIWQFFSCQFCPFTIKKNYNTFYFYFQIIAVKVFQCFIIGNNANITDVIMDYIKKKYLLTVTFLIESSLQPLSFICEV